MLTNWAGRPVLHSGVDFFNFYPTAGIQHQFSAELSLSLPPPLSLPPSLSPTDEHEQDVNDDNTFKFNFLSPYSVRSNGVQLVPCGLPCFKGEGKAIVDENRMANSIAYGEKGGGGSLHTTSQNSYWMPCIQQ